MKSKVIFSVASQKWEGTWVEMIEEDTNLTMAEREEKAISAAEEKVRSIVFSKNSLVVIAIRIIGEKIIEPKIVRFVTVTKSVTRKKKGPSPPPRTFH